MQKTTTSALLTLEQAAEAWARLTGISPPHTSTLSRWMLYGVRSVRLRGTRIGGRSYTTEQDLSDFLRQLNADDNEVER